MNAITHIFFDLDHTLWDFESNSRATIREIVDHFDLDIEPDAFIPVYERINGHYWAEYRHGRIEKKVLRNIRFEKSLGEFGITDPTLVVEICDYYVEEGPRKQTLFPNAVEVLEWLEGKYQLHLISNGFKEVQAIKLKSSGLDRFFQNPFVSEDVGVKKPHPKIFEYAMDQTGSKPNASAMVGDNMEADIQGAHNVGMTTIHFNPHSEAHEFVPNHEIRDLIELKSIF